MDGDLRGARGAAPAGARNLPGFAAGRGRTIPVPRRAGPPALDGPDAARLQGDLTRVAFRRPRILGTARRQSRIALHHAEYEGSPTGHRSASALLRPQGLGLVGEADVCNEPRTANREPRTANSE